MSGALCEEFWGVEGGVGDGMGCACEMAGGCIVGMILWQHILAKIKAI